MQLKHVLSTLKSFKKQVILGPVFKLTEAVFELIVPLVMAKIIDVGVASGDYGYVLRMGGLMLLLGAVGLASSLTCQRFAAIASQGYGTKMRNRLFAKINSFSHAELDRFGTPSLITRLTNDVNQLQLAVAMLIRLVVRAPFLAVGAIFMAMTIDLKMSLIFPDIHPCHFIGSIYHYEQIRSLLPCFAKKVGYFVPNDQRKFKRCSGDSRLFKTGGGAKALSHGQ